MIELVRKKDEKWIFQKNISSKNIITSFVQTIEELQDINDKESIKISLKLKNAYKGRSDEGSESTMGVRLSQMCFYMFGYKNNKNYFIPTQMAKNLLENEDLIAENMLVSLFSMQYPHPFSKTPYSFKLYVGRLIIKLLTDEKINKRLYVDEFIWFLPFIKTINEKRYNELTDSILEYRKLSYDEKKTLFESVKNYNEVFSNCMHEFKYYFMKQFEEFGVFDLRVDLEHNDGKLFSFKHGKSTYRKDNIDRYYSGYVKLSDDVFDSAVKLINRFSAFDIPETLADEDIYTKQEWITNLYDVLPLRYLSTINPDSKTQQEVTDIINNMVYTSKYGSVDGKDFENSLKSVFDLFDRIVDSEIISGAGDTVLLCSVEDRVNNLYKMNVDGKSRNSSLNMNVKRLNRHLERHGSKYCIVVAPKFSKGTILDIKGEKIVTIRSDILAKYCSKECLSNKNYTADYASIEKIIYDNLGNDISEEVDELINSRYGITLSKSRSENMETIFKEVICDFSSQPVFTVADDDITKTYSSNNEKK